MWTRAIAIFVNYARMSFMYCNIDDFCDEPESNTMPQHNVVE